jgi:hypothetical protein
MHGFGLQDVPAPYQPIGNSHAASVVVVQLPVESQQAPIGGAHGFGEQAPSTVQTPTQAACCVTAQAPSGWQQEPVGCWHRFGSQVPNIVQVPGQSDCVITVQVPSG